MFMAVIKGVGLPRNESERKAIAYLRDCLPDQYIIFHNLELSEHTNQFWEYDLIVVGEYAVYMLEVKGYRGLIRGNVHQWKLEDGSTYENPIPWANTKA